MGLVVPASAGGGPPVAADRGLFCARLSPLYTKGVSEYGVFHLLDYPVFVGLAAYLSLTGLKKTLLGYRPIEILRISAAITLMWASAER